MFEHEGVEKKFKMKKDRKILYPYMCWKVERHRIESKKKSHHCQHKNADNMRRVHFRRKSISMEYQNFMITSSKDFIIRCQFNISHPISYLYSTLQINQYVAVSRNAFMVWHVMRLQKFYVKLMLILHPIHSNGRLTIRQKHLKCRRVITESIHHEHHRSPILQWR